MRYFNADSPIFEITIIRLHHLRKACFPVNQPLNLGLWMFVLVVSVHPYCAHKFTCHVMHWACALTTKMNNDRADGHCYSFAWIKWSWMFGDSYFSFQKQILFTISPHCPKMNTNQCWKLKTFHDFCPRDIKSSYHAGNKACEIVVAKWELVLWGTSLVD